MKRNYSWAQALVLCACLVLTGTLFSQTKAQQEKIISRYDTSKLSALQSEFTAKNQKQKQEAFIAAQQRNLPTTVTLDDGGIAELQYIADDGSPIYYRTFNVAAARSTRANFLNSGGGLGLNIDGQNMTAYVWDGGHARVSHQEYDGPGGANRVTVEDAASEGGTQLNFHAAHVTGTITASGVQASAKGMAPQSRVRGYMWNNDVAEATSAAANGMLLSNHSYGYRSDLVPDYYFGAYISESRNWDEIMHNAPYYLMVVAAGNDGNQNSYNGSPLGGNSSYDKLTGHSTSKNNLVVANAQDANIDSNGNLISVTINSGSSEGPTDDLRIKPDITGNGTQLTSTYETSNSAYGTITGTSMASPNVTGSLLLLQQHANNTFGSFMRASTLKGLALHTADDIGPTGPDAVHGWGLMNTKRAAEAISEEGVNSTIDELTLISGNTYTITVDADGVNDLMASISWTDVPGAATTQTNSSTKRLVNDLDIRITQNGTTYFPYRLTGVNTNGLGDNTSDPFERIQVANASGSYTITVSHKGSLNGGSQNYSLILTGINAGGATCVATTPTGVNASGVGSNAAIIGYDVVSGASYDVRYRENGASSWSVISSASTSASVNGLTPTTGYEAQVRSRCPDGSTSSYSASVNFTTTEVQLDYCDSASTNVNDEYISRVQLEDINNASGAQFYSDFTNVNTALSKDDEVTVTITPTWTGTVYNEGYAVWIDYNQDGDFTDAGEQVFTQAATNASPISGNFTVSNSAADGATRMRVSMMYNGIPTACQSFTYGEVEDYTVTITGTAADTEAPTVPTNLSASNITETTLSLSWNASSDNVGVTAYDVYQGTALLGSVAGTTANITGLTAATSYTFSVRAKDEAGNISAASNEVSVTTAGGGGSGCVGGIASFPYGESFESNLGDWSQSTADDINWSRDANGTPSNGTGPSTGAAGSFYMYVEASGNGTGYPNKRAILNSPCFDLSGTSEAAITFNYHMYGASDMGSIALEVSDDDGASWSSIWNQTGNQGNAWQEESIDLSAYVGGSIQLRFNRLTGSTWQADIAIDNLRVTNSAPSNDPCDGVAEWQSGQSYNVGDRVTYQGGLYERAPSSWTYLGPCGATNSNATQSDGDDLAGPPITAFTIYPNPVTSGVLNVDVLGAKATDYVIFNVVGQRVASGAYERTLDVSQLPSGMYLIRVATEGQQFTERFIVE